MGAEIDLIAKYQHNRHFASMVGYSHFFPGTFVEQSGSRRGIDFAYCVFQYTF